MTIDMTAILSAPDDDAPRGSLAQALDAGGNPRGHFITLQLRASVERKSRGATRDYWSLNRSANSLLERHRAEWAKDVSPLVQSARFHRGFVESVTIDARTFLARGVELYRLAPIRSVTLTGAQPVIHEVAGSQLLQRLAHLGLQANDLGDEGAEAIAKSVQLRSLRLLDLSFDGVTRKGLDAIAASASLAKVLFINLAGNPCGEPVETFGIDSMTGEVVQGTTELPKLGRELAAKYGDRPWLHAPSQLLVYPPSVEDV